MNIEQQSTRQQKFGRQIQKDMSDILLRDAAALIKGSMVSVTAVRMTPDLALARIYLSIFPFANAQQIVQLLNNEQSALRNALGIRVKHQFRHVPELIFYLDDSLEYIQNIDDLLKK